MIYPNTLPTDKEIEILQTLANNLAFAVKAIDLNELKRKAYEQIKKYRAICILG